MKEKGQKRLTSLTETIINLSVGYLLAVFVQILIFPLWGIEVSIAANFHLAAIFAVISLVRTYLVRRFFNWIHMKGHQ